MNFRDSVLIEPDFHDESLTGLRMIGADAHLFFKAQHAEFRMILPNVVMLKADGFMQGNIVFGISIYQEPSRELVKKLYDFTESEPHNYLAVTLEKIKKENLRMFELTSSYGCEMLALFSGEIEIREETD
jgi:hypothetical protein